MGIYIYIYNLISLLVSVSVNVKYHVGLEADKVLTLPGRLVSALICSDVTSIALRVTVRDVYKL